MKPRHARKRTGGFTGWDLLVVIVTLGILLFITLPAVTRDSRRSHRISCVSNLKQIGLAMHMWAYDHGNKFPMAVSGVETNAGTMEYNSSGEVWRHFTIIFKELNSPKVLTCGNDKERQRTSNWQDITNNSHVSYFVGLDADETRPQTILSGDRNLKSSAPSTNGVLFLRTGDTLEWTKAIHNQAGNIGFGNGSVQQVTTAGVNKHLQDVFLATTQTVHRLALPE